MSNDAEKCADDLIDELRTENERLRGIIERAKKAFIEKYHNQFSGDQLISTLDILNEVNK